MIILNSGHLIKVFHKGENFAKAKSEPFLLAEDHDLADGDGAILVGVNFIKKFLKVTHGVNTLKKLLYHFFLKDN
jgi:hypothetical protein